jgi:hypothetical protein
MGPIGERQEAARFRRARDGPSKTLVKSEKRRIKAESGLPFLWILSFGNAKESISVVGPRTDIQTTRRDSDTKKTKAHTTRNHNKHSYLINSCTPKPTFDGTQKSIALKYPVF